MTDDQSVHVRPWYRQFWPWLLIAIPAAGIVMATITTVVALRVADVDVRKAEEPPLDKSSWRLRGDAQ
jgi:hypothetical protein